jgi:hypothetical protein
MDISTSTYQVFLWNLKTFIANLQPSHSQHRIFVDQSLHRLLLLPLVPKRQARGHRTYRPLQTRLSIRSLTQSQLLQALFASEELGMHCCEAGIHVLQPQRLALPTILDASAVSPRHGCEDYPCRAIEVFVLSETGGDVDRVAHFPQHVCRDVVAPHLFSDQLHNCLMLFGIAELGRRHM